MGNYFVILSFLFFSIQASAHEYFFAFAELEYDEANGKMEATITVTTHDLENYLIKKNILQKKLEDCQGDSIAMLNLENFLNQHFTLNLNPGEENSIMDGIELFLFQLDGIETQLTGTVQFFMSATIKRPVKKIDVLFDLLMDNSSEQQNKMTFIYREIKKTFVFLPTKKSEIIELK